MCEVRWSMWTFHFLFHRQGNVSVLAMESRWVLFGLMGGRDAPGEGLGSGCAGQRIFELGPQLPAVDLALNVPEVGIALP